jgi:DNA-binding HxlR family transcriptional regulator
MTLRKAGSARRAPPRPCPLERYLDVVSGAWVPRIISYLLEGPHRFADLQRNIEGVSAKVLTSKLRALEREQIVQRTVLPASPPQVEYALTERGRAFEPVFRAMEETAGRVFSESQPALNGPPLAARK